MLYQEILNILDSNLNVDEFAHEDYDDSIIQSLGIGNINFVAKYGGEDKGTNWYKIFHFIEHDVYMKISGYYTSYNGVEFDNGWGDAIEVKPETISVVVYTPKL